MTLRAWFCSDKFIACRVDLTYSDSPHVDSYGSAQGCHYKRSLLQHKVTHVIAMVDDFTAWVALGRLALGTGTLIMEKIRSQHEKTLEKALN